MKENIVSKYRHTALFYLLSTLVPWAFWFAASYVSQHLIDTEGTWVASLLGLIGLCFPMVLTLILVLRSGTLRKDFFGRFLNLSPNKWSYYLTACLLMPASILCAMAISLLFGYSPSQFIVTGHYTFTSGVFPVWFLLILAPTLEELAWHGYGTDSLRLQMNLFKTSIVFAAYWAVWHFPLAGIKGYYHANVVHEGWLYSLNFIVSIFPFVILMNWLYYKTNRNVLVAIVFHITAGYFNEIFSTHPDSKCIQTLLLLAFSVIVVLKDRQLFFNRAHFAATNE